MNIQAPRCIEENSTTVDCQIKVTIGLAIYIYIPDQTPTIPNLFWYGIAINIPQ